MRKRLLAVAAATLFVVAACNNSGTATEAPASAAAGGCIVGVSWNNYQQERWAKADEPNIKKASTSGRTPATTPSSS
jgi:ABC-type xylose transport system substrate-binding protein